MSTASESGSDKIVFQKNVTGRGSQVLDDAEFVKMYDRSTSKTLNTSSANDNAQSNQQKEHVQKWKVGDQCMALYEVDGKWYPAKIEQISPVKNTCTVSYIGYDQKAILKLEDILGSAEFAANSHFQHHSVDINWYFNTSHSLSFFEQTPPIKRRRLSIEQPIMEFGGFFKVPDIPQHILEGKSGPKWREREGRPGGQKEWHETTDRKRPKTSDYFAYLRFLFRMVPRQPSIGQHKINELYKCSTSVAERFFSTYGLFSTNLSHCQALNKFLLETNCCIDNEKSGTATDNLKTPDFISENSTTVRLYLEGIHDKLRPNIESDVEAADDHGDEREAEGTSGTTTKIADNDVKKDAFPIPDLCPPPPPSMFGKIAVAGNEKEALTNMLMSWYMSGYHTGFYQGVMHEKTTRQKPK